MPKLPYSILCLTATALIYSLCSKQIFDKVYLTSNVVVDEEFHLPVGRAFCEHHYRMWHPKITTPPGLYILSSLVFSGFKLCGIYWMRFTSLIFSSVNLLLFYHLLGLSNHEAPWKNIVSALNLSLLPPMYFFSHLYYTDIASLTTILLLFIFFKRDNHFVASIFGMLSITFRQTNIVWVIMTLGCYILKETNAVHHKKTQLGKAEVSLKEFFQLLVIYPPNVFIALRRSSLTFWLNVASYLSVLICFGTFVYLNGGIVCGDKTAHLATIHLPQLFYFALFTMAFAWPYFISEVPAFFRFITINKVGFVIAVGLSLAIVYGNTLVHPYMLADNRHYVFYFWNRFYGRFALFRYTMVPVYLFALFVIISKVGNKSDVTFLFFFIFCTSVALLTQRLIEFRYFLVPFILFRINFKYVSSRSLLLEFLSHLVVNAATIYIFSTKVIHWNDLHYPQRLIW